MALSRLTLAQQLAQLQDPTPLDIDPDDDSQTKEHEEEDMDDLDEAADFDNRAHYLTVERSNLRNPHESLNEPKYAGRKITRGLGDLQLSDGNEDELGSLEHGNESAESDSEPTSAASGSRATSEESPDRQEEELNNVMQRARHSDRLKGKAVSRQMAIWDAILDARIRLQKTVASCNILPVKERLEIPDAAGGRESTDLFIQECLLLSEDLFELEETLMERSPALNQDERGTKSRKRVRQELEEEDKDTLTAQVRAASRRFSRAQQDSHRNTLTILQKWSSKIQAVTPAALLPSSRNAFQTKRNAHLKSVNELIQESLSDSLRLLARTQMRRGASRIGQETLTSQDIEGKPLGEGNIFDDTDFYQQLLREVIDRQTSNGYGDDDVNPRPKKVKKKVDTRASKGRKLRYEVHEKMQNFMVPVPTIVDGWHEEKIDELFASLLGKLPSNAEPGENVLGRQQALASVPRDGFRIFG